MFSIIPLLSVNQTFDIVLPVDGNNLKLGFYVYWNKIAEYWCMDITDYRVGKKVLSGIPLLTGENMLEQYKYLAIGSAYLVNLSGKLPDTPNDNNLGTSFQLIWSDTNVE